MFKEDLNEPKLLCSTKQKNMPKLYNTYSVEDCTCENAEHLGTSLELSKSQSGFARETGAKVPNTGWSNGKPGSIL